MILSHCRDNLKTQQIHVDIQTDATLFGHMEFLAYIQKYIRMAGLLAILGAVLLFPPVSAHAELIHGDTSPHQADHLTDGNCLAGFSHDLEEISQDDVRDVVGADSHDGSGQCCSEMCVATALLEHNSSHNLAVRDSHVSQSFFVLASANLPGFLRPPNP